MKTKIIVTHTAPDFDAITFVWLMARFAPGFENAKVEFMPLNFLDKKMLSEADAVGDIGGIYDPSILRFDHHHLEGAASTSTCATMQTWRWLLSEGVSLQYLESLITQIYQGDLAQTPLVGIHSQMFGWKASANEAGVLLSDIEIYNYGAHILDQINFWLKRKAENKMQLEQKTVWVSEDGMIRAIKGGSVGVSFSAYEEGTRVVVFEGEPIELDNGRITYPVGASRAPEWQSPHLGDIVNRLVHKSTNPDIKKELSKWFRHNGGFFAGRGSKKAPDEQPLEVDIKEIAFAIYLLCEDL
jgi:hypothetical protein